MNALKDKLNNLNPLYLGWSVGTFGASILLNIQNVAALFFFVTVLKVDPLVAGAIISGAKLYDTFTDPLMGAITDSTKSRWGRRRPYLLAGGVLCGASVLMLFAVPQLSESHTVIYITAALLMLATAYTVFNVPYLSMPAEMVSNYHERSVLMSYRVFFISIATYTATSGAPALLGLLQDFYGMDKREAYAWLGVVAGLLVSTAMIASFFGTRDAPLVEKTKVKMSILEQARMMFSSKPFVLFLGLKLTGLFALAAMLAAKFFFITYFMQKSLAIAAIFGTASMVGQLLALPFWVRLSKWRGKKAILVYSSIAQLAFTATWFFSGPQEPLYIYALRGLLLGIGGCGTLLGTQAMLPDVMEYDYRRTGLHREGIFAGLASFIEKLAFALSGIVIGGFLAYMGFDRNAGAAGQTEQALFGILACQALIPMSMYVLKLILLAMYDLDEKKLKSLTPPEHDAAPA